MTIRRRSPIGTTVTRHPAISQEPGLLLGMVQRLLAITMARPGIGHWLDRGYLDRIRPLLTTMTATDVLRVISVLETSGVIPVVAGGWGVDALVGRQTRHHADLDLIVIPEACDLTVRHLRDLGFRSVVTHHAPHAALSTRIVTRDSAGHLVDLHPCDPVHLAGKLTSASPTTVPMAVAQSLAHITTGRIAGRQVYCLTECAQRSLHQGYLQRRQDLHDLRLLARADGRTDVGIGDDQSGRE